MSIFRRGYSDADLAAIVLRDTLGGVAPDVLDNMPAQGCCGCGTWLADVVRHPTPDYPRGDAYCWRCVDKRPHLTPDEYRVLPGRER